MPSGPSGFGSLMAASGPLARRRILVGRATGSSVAQEAGMAIAVDCPTMAGLREAAARAVRARGVGGTGSSECVSTGVATRSVASSPRCGSPGWGVSRIMRRCWRGRRSWPAQPLGGARHSAARRPPRSAPGDGTGGASPRCVRTGLWRLLRRGGRCACVERTWVTELGGGLLSPLAMQSPGKHVCVCVYVWLRPCVLV